MVTMLEKNKIPQRNYNRAADFALHNVGRDLDAVAIRIAQAQAALEAGLRRQRNRSASRPAARRGHVPRWHRAWRPRQLRESCTRPLPSRARGGSTAGRYHGRQGRHECHGGASLAVAVLSAGVGYDGGRGTDIGRRVLLCFLSQRQLRSFWYSGASEGALGTIAWGPRTKVLTRLCALCHQREKPWNDPF